MHSRTNDCEIGSGRGIAYSTFCLMAGAIFSMFAIKPLSLAIETRSWIETPCVIVNCELEEIVDPVESGTAYRVDVKFSYQWDGQVFQSNRFDLPSITTNTGVSSKRAFVQTHPPGTHTVCFVDPRNPAQAILIRGWSVDMWWVVIPIVVMVIGLAGVSKYLIAMWNQNPPAQSQVA